MENIGMLNNVGNTPIVRLLCSPNPKVHIYAKLEFYNPTGSIKDRAADYILRKIIQTGEISSDTQIIESSSGNFGIALSAYCDLYRLPFICVIDPLTAPINEMLIRSFHSEVIKVTHRDSSGGYLLNRLETVQNILDQRENCYWVNQYANPYNREAYQQTIGVEITKEFQKLHYIFIAVSSGGTIAGISTQIKACYPNAKVIAVDIEGSVIFGLPPRQRSISGIGSSKVPDNLQYACIDDVVIVTENEIKNGCKELLANDKLFTGGSSGAVYVAMKKYFESRSISDKTIVASVFPDSGNRYYGSIYD